ncbi:MAG: MFS transporter [Acidobacteriota bacterium]|nr:MFS transporter [Acidobacteriota bacterium]
MRTSRPPTPSPAPVGDGAPGGTRVFLSLWAGQVLSLLGTAIGRFTVMLWAWEQTGEATTLALLGFFEMGTTVLLSPLAGAVADRMPRKWALILSDLGAGAVTAALLTLYLTGHLQVWHLYVGAVLSGAFETFQFPAYSAAVTVLVPRRHYARASGLISMAETASRAFGPPLAAALLPWLNYGGLLVLDLATLGLALMILVFLRIPEPEVSEEGARSRGSLLHEASWGFRYIFARRGLLGLQLLLSAVNFLASFAVVLRSPMILARTAGDAQILGNVQAAAGIGGLVGGLLLASWGGPRRRVHGVFAGIFLAMLGNLILGSGQTAWVWAAGAFLFPLAITVSNGSNQAIWQAKVAPDLQGRVFAVRRQIAQLAGLPGMLLAGPLADRLFEPALSPGGQLTPSLGPVFGTGPGAGMGLLLALSGIAGLLLLSIALAQPSLRHVEDSLPDHQLAQGSQE